MSTAPVITSRRNLYAIIANRGSLAAPIGNDGVQVCRGENVSKE
jgi:hypothetical protein